MFRDLICIAITFFFVVVASPDLNVWPLPTTWTNQGSQTLSLSSNQFKFVCSGQSCSGVLQRAFARYTKLIFFAGESSRKHVNASGALIQVSVSANVVVPLQNGMDGINSLFL